jgi:hypothetical protein
MSSSDLCGNSLPYPLEEDIYTDFYDQFWSGEFGGQDFGSPDPHEETLPNDNDSFLVNTQHCNAESTDVDTKSIILSKVKKENDRASATVDMDFESVEESTWMESPDSCFIQGAAILNQLLRELNIVSSDHNEIHRLLSTQFLAQLMAKFNGFNCKQVANLLHVCYPDGWNTGNIQVAMSKHKKDARLPRRFDETSQATQRNPKASGKPRKANASDAQVMNAIVVLLNRTQEKKLVRGEWEQCLLQNGLSITKDTIVRRLRLWQDAPPSCFNYSKEDFGGIKATLGIDTRKTKKLNASTKKLRGADD